MLFKITAQTKWSIRTTRNGIAFYEVIGMEYILKKTIETESVKIRVFSPVLNEAERERRMKQIHKAAANLLKKVN
jgi:hypothetical protein